MFCRNTGGRGAAETCEEGGFLSDGVIIRNISVKESLYYIRCESNRFLEKGSNQGRSGDGEIEKDSKRRLEWIGRVTEGGAGSRMVNGVRSFYLHTKGTKKRR